MRKIKQKIIRHSTPTDVGYTAVDVLKHALNMFKDVAGNIGVPGLEAGVGVLSTVLQMIQDAHGNIEAIDDLAKELKVLTNKLQQSIERHGKDVPPALKAGVGELLSSWEGIGVEAQGLKSRNIARRIFSSEGDVKKIAGFVRRLSSSIQYFTMERLVAIEFAVNDLKENAQDAGKKLDGIQDGVQRTVQMVSEGYAVPPYVATKAGYDCSPDRTPCLDSTRTGILDKITTWAFDRAPPQDAANHTIDSAPENPRIFWLNGLAGTGKTTVAYTIAQRCHAQGILGASFFCSRSIADCNDPSKIVTTIAYQLGTFYPPYRAHIDKILRKDPLLVYASVSRQFDELIVRPLALLRDKFPLCVVVIDALDECRDTVITSAILSTLLKHADDLSPLLFFLTSRPETHIVTSFDTRGYRGAFGQLLLHEVALEVVTTDIQHFLEISLLEVSGRFRLKDPWPAVADLSRLSRLADGLFIFASTAVKFIEDKKHREPKRRLEELISKAVPHGSHTLLDSLYSQILDSAFPEDPSAGLKSILGAIVLIKDPLPPGDLSRLISLSPETVYSFLGDLRSVLVVPEPEESSANIRIIHPTFPEFLLDPGRCTNPSFAVDSRHQHMLLLRGCLGAMRELKRDMCDIRDPSLLNLEVADLSDRIAKAIPPYLGYACRHWSAHLPIGGLPDDMLDALVEFAEKLLLYWLEACSLLGILRDAISALNESQLKLMGIDDERARRVAVLFNDCERLVIGFFPSISSSALQLYHSVLSFMPRETALATTYAGERRANTSVKVIHGAARLWDACLGTVIGHGGWTIFGVDFSPDGRTIVSSGRDRKIRLWDALTYTLLLVLSGHTNSVFSVKYSPDGTRIVSASEDSTVKIWDAVSGILVRTLAGHAEWVRCAAFTPDGARIVSGCGDGTIKIWDVQAGTCLATLTKHQDGIKSLTVSPDGLWMASCSADEPVYLWSLEAPYPHRLVPVQDISGCSVVFTPDSSEVLATPWWRSEDPISVWDVDSGEHLRNLKPLGGTPYCLSFSTAGDRLACGSHSGLILIIDPSNGDVQRTLVGHTSEVYSVAYNRERTRLVSCSNDGFLRLWDVREYALNAEPAKSTTRDSNLSGGVHSLDCDTAVFYRDGSRVLSRCENSTILVERTDSWHEVYKLLPGEKDFRGLFPYLAVSPDGSAILTTGRRDGEEASLQVWDAATGSRRAQFADARHDSYSSRPDSNADRTLRSSVRFLYRQPEHLVLWNDVLGCMPHCFGGLSSSVMFSEDSRYLLTGSHTGDPDSNINDWTGTATRDVKDTAARLWSVATGDLIREFSGHDRPVLCVAFSLDAKRIATGSADTSAIICDFNTWALLTTGSADTSIIIWDFDTGASLATCKDDAPVSSVALSASGGLVASGGWAGGIKVWNAETGESLQYFSGSPMTVWSVAFTPGGDVVISGQGYTMCLWDVETGDCLHTLNRETWHRDIELAPDSTGVVIPGGRVVQLWAPVEADVQATTTLPWLPRRTWPVYWIEDEWLFSLAPGRRSRLCWLPADWRVVRGYFSHTVVLKGRRIVDFTGLNNYLDTLHSAAQ